MTARQTSRLPGLVQGSPPAASAGQPADEQLALELLSEATYSALCHCSTSELVETRQQLGGDHPVDARHLDAPVEQEPAIWQETDHFAYPHRIRQQIVEHYRDARSKGQIVNRDRRAQANYWITSKTLLSYEREFQDHRQTILAGPDGG